SALLPMRDRDTGRINLTLKSLDAGEALRAVGGVPIRMEGQVSGTVKGTITAAAPDRPRSMSADVDLSAPRLRVQGVPAERLRGTVHYRDQEAIYELQADALGGKVQLDGRVPVGAEKESREGEGRLRSRGARLSRLGDALEVE